MTDERLNLKVWRENAHIERKAAASHAHIHYSTLQGYELGAYTPDFNTFLSLLSLYGVSLSSIEPDALDNISVNLPHDILDLIRLKRTSLGKSQEYMAKVCGYKNQCSYSNFETGEIAAKMKTLYKIAEELGIPRPTLINLLVPFSFSF